MDKLINPRFPESSVFPVSNYPGYLIYNNDPAQVAGNLRRKSLGILVSGLALIAAAGTTLKEIPQPELFKVVEAATIFFVTPVVITYSPGYFFAAKALEHPRDDSDLELREQYGIKSIGYRFEWPEPFEVGTVRPQQQSEYSPKPEAMTLSASDLT